MGSRKTVPPKAFLIVPFGDSHTVVQSVCNAPTIFTALTLLKVEFLHARLVGGDSCALNTHRVLLDSLCGVDRDLIVRLISIWQSKIIVLEVDIQVRVDKLVLDILPYNPGHLVPIQLHHRVLHRDLLDVAHLP